MADATIGSASTPPPIKGVKTSLPGEYTPISAKTLVAVTAFGGALAILGGFGVWIRRTEGLPGKTPEEVSAVWGYTSGGLLVVILGFVALASSVAWMRRELHWKVIPFLMGPAVALETVLRLSDLDQIVRTMILRTADAVRETAESGVTNYHVGFGWGAWFLLAAAVTLVIGSIAGVLRELDLRGRTSE